jgi:voltage-gated potassium channel
MSRKKILNVSKMLLSLIIIVDVILITYSLIFNISDALYQKILLFDIVTCIILLFDFFYGFFKSSDKKQYFRDNWIELIASIPFDIVLSPFIVLRYLRLIRIVRVIFLVSEYFEVVGKFLKNTRLDEILAVFIIIVIGSTLSLYLVDPGMNNIFDDLWFVVVSITTVGYGDITPVSVYGKILSLILLIVGVFIFSAITGAISTYFMDNLLKEGSYRINELNEKVDVLNSQIEENNQKINELNREIAELKELIREKE